MQHDLLCPCRPVVRTTVGLITSLLVAPPAGPLTLKSGGNDMHQSTDVRTRALSVRAGLRAAWRGSIRGWLERRRGGWRLFALIPLLLLATSCSDSTGSDSSVNWQAVIPNLEDNVYMVVAQWKLPNGTIQNWPNGTAFPVATSINRDGMIGGVLATNGHVLDGIFELQDELRALRDAKKITDYGFFVVRAKTEIGGEGTFRIVFGKYHAGYFGNSGTTDQTPDVALLQVNRALPAILTLASPSELLNLKTGQPVATIGYPIEGGPSTGQRPIPTFKSGTISALRPYKTSTAPSPETTRLIQHDISTTGGTSGSPLFNRDGRVIAVHNSGDYIMVGNTRIRSGAGSYAIRADDLRALMESMGIR